jgi:peptidoglycan/xylan/chitin deacetylase (PgdA/CDA1 family)
MRIPGLGRARRLANRFAPGALVLLYHRVAELETDPQWLAVPPDVFDEQLDLLKRSFVVLTLGDLVKRLGEGALPKRSVVITFDDGYSDNLYEAKPVLERHGLPASVFVASGFVGGREEFFWDELDRLLLQPGELPSEFAAPPPEDGVAVASPMACDIGAEEPWRWSLGDAAVYSAERAREHAKWNVLSKDTPTARHAAYRALCAGMAGATPEVRRRWLARVREALGATEGARKSHRVVSVEELRGLAAGGFVEIGAHTVTHARLSSLPVSAQRREMVESKGALEGLVGRAVTTFSYPFGNHVDYTAQTVAAAREAGFVAACANFGGCVRRGTDVMQLNRVLVRDWPAEELDRRIRGWFGD